MREDIFNFMLESFQFLGLALGLTIVVALWAILIFIVVFEVMEFITEFRATKNVDFDDEGDVE